MEGLGFSIKVKPLFMAEYKRVHAGVWPEVLEKSKIATFAITRFFCMNPTT